MNQVFSLKEELLKQYKYKIELHAHTLPASSCSEVTPEELVQIYHAKGFAGLVVTNHFRPGDASREQAIDAYIADYEAAKREGDRLGVKVMLGVEICFLENRNDYLIYGVNREILGSCFDYLEKGVCAFRREVPLDESVFIQAHPFRDRMERCNPNLLDGMETFNMHPGHNSRPGLAARFAEENRIKIRIAGSDFHHPGLGHEAVSAMRCKQLPENSFELARILKSGDYIFELGEGAVLLP